VQPVPAQRQTVFLSMGTSGRNIAHPQPATAPEIAREVLCHYQREDIQKTSFQTAIEIVSVSKIKTKNTFVTASSKLGDQVPVRAGLRMPKSASVIVGPALSYWKDIPTILLSSSGRRTIATLPLASPTSAFVITPTSPVNAFLSSVARYQIPSIFLDVSSHNLIPTNTAPTLPSNQKRF